MTNGIAKSTDAAIRKIIDGTTLSLGQDRVIDLYIPRASLDYVPADATINRAIELVAPRPALRSKCHEKVRLMVAFLHADHFSRPTPKGEIKRQFRQVASGLKGAKAALKRVSKESREWLLSCTDQPELFVLNLNLVIEQAKSGVKYLGSKRGRHQEIDKLNAAAFSFQLIREFGAAAPTLTTKGPYYELASTLYEAATSIPSCNLETYCRAYFKRYARSDR
jgi:hypothetical protein